MSAYEEFCGCGEWDCTKCHGGDAVPGSSKNAYANGAPPAVSTETQAPTLISAAERAFLEREELANPGCDILFFRLWRTLVAAESRLAQASHAGEEDTEAVVGLLAFFVGFMDEGDDATPDHRCEFVTNPEKGACEFHEMWADAITLLAARHPGERETDA